jgi:hypothetical protein
MSEVQFAELFQRNSQIFTHVPEEIHSHMPAPFCVHSAGASFSGLPQVSLQVFAFGSHMQSTSALQWVSS